MASELPPPEPEGIEEHELPAQNGLDGIFYIREINPDKDGPKNGHPDSPLDIEETDQVSNRSADSNALQISDDEKPQGAGLKSLSFVTQSKKHHNRATRRWVALTILLLLGALYGAGVAALWFEILTPEQLGEYVRNFVGLQTMTALAVGFYFAARDN